MATLKLNSAAPKEPVNFTFGVASFSLSGSGSYDTDDVSVIDVAKLHPWLDVTVEAVAYKPEDDESYDASDPHDNPSVDHLAAAGSSESVAAADAADKAIQEAHFGAPVEAPVENPPVSNALRETLSTAGVVSDTPKTSTEKGSN